MKGRLSLVTILAVLLQHEPAYAQGKDLAAPSPITPVVSVVGEKGSSVPEVVGEDTITLHNFHTNIKQNIKNPEEMSWEQIVPFLPPLKQTIELLEVYKAAGMTPFAALLRALVDSAEILAAVIEAKEKFESEEGSAEAEK